MGGKRAPRAHAAGYVRLYMPEHPIAARDGYVLEHRYVVYEAGLAVPKGWHIHHLDGDKTNNDLDNLVVCRPRAHKRLHHQLEPFAENQYGTYPVLLTDEERKQRQRERNAARADYRREWKRRRRAAA